MRKLLFMTNPVRIEGLLKPHWSAALQGQAAELLQAVPNMLEVVPSGVNKWAGLQVCTQDTHTSPGSRSVEAVRAAQRVWCCKCPEPGSCKHVGPVLCH